MAMRFKEFDALMREAESREAWAAAVKDGKAAKEMNKERLANYYCLSNCVVCDQFLRDDWKTLLPDAPAFYTGLGAIGAEALSYGRPLITNFHLPVGVYPHLPSVLAALAEDQILQRLIEVTDMTMDDLRALGREGRRSVLAQGRGQPCHRQVPRGAQGIRVLAESVQRSLVTDRDALTSRRTHRRRPQGQAVIAAAILYRSYRRTKRLF